MLYVTRIIQDLSKSLRAIVLLLSGLTLIVGCDSSQGPDTERPVMIAGTTFPDTAGEGHWLGFYERLVEATGGQMPLRLLIYGQLGSEDQLVSGLRRGRVQFANLSAMAVSTVVPEMALLYAPFLFDDEAEADYVYDRYLTPLYRGLLAEKGLHLVSWYEIGFLEVYGKEPVLVPGDARGRRFRVGAGPAARLFAGAIGADVIPLGFADVVASLQTGLIESGENSVSLYARTGIAGEAPHLTMTDHAFGISAIVASKDWWDSLSYERQQQVSNAWPDIAETRRAVRAESQSDLQYAAELGIVVHHLSKEQRGLWREVTAGATDRIIEIIGGRSREVYEVIRNARQEHRLQRNN
ncbi:MAG: TRAP transporter substrate-binding protein DctP [Gammaproteobacteria bacterium]|jgi:TRAP-type C4-dicarboxylate transport system substrate-binding protein|nr:TRAP transporter substrate-binding protein DctP [Gammaproteobacteria bacterium]